MTWRTHLYHALLWLIALIFFAPVAWIILSSFKTSDQILAVPPVFFFRPTFANYARVLADPGMLHSFFNSLVLSISAVVIAVAVALLAAFSFSRFKPPGTDFLMFLLLSIRMLPGSAAILPVYLMYVGFGWKDTYWGMILFYAMFSIPFSVWILKGFIDGVSPRFDETGLVNGASWLSIITRLIFPQVMPGVIAALIFNFIFVWNEFLFNYIIGGPTTTNIPTALSTGLYSGGGVDWTFVSCVTTLYIIPPIIIVYVFQRYLLVGMTFGTVRGEV
ncbi:carbohydrate ABC transporter permease [Acidisoma cladoniae]|jgi:multiple sugar transport system permease protein|uniref:carbohydrate ABC transporter permease n=1 Tax=Acidisoma cladoniae TaxID=3040935 RepID=UPI00254F7773|nr:carbohydrate ABC transporter permease [Acidisoma sp. PAMC 29798]